MTESESTVLRLARMELSELVEQDSNTPAELRRIAELVEVVGGDAEALPWWEEASAAGDRDARDYLTVVLEEIVFGVGEE